MNRQKLDLFWDHFRQCNGIAIRAIEAIPADQIDRAPIPKMRTPKELVVHLYAEIVHGMAEGIARGALEYDTTREREAKISASLKTRDDVVRFARESWNAADRAIQSLTDEQIHGEVKTPFGKDYPGSVMLEIIREEFLHHRGQLYAYLRVMGVEPPMVWDFENNAPEFRPKAAAATS